MDRGLSGCGCAGMMETMATTRERGETPSRRWGTGGDSEPSVVTMMEFPFFCVYFGIGQGRECAFG